MVRIHSRFGTLSTVTDLVLQKVEVPAEGVRELDIPALFRITLDDYQSTIVKLRHFKETVCLTTCYVCCTVSLTSEILGAQGTRVRRGGCRTIVGSLFHACRTIGCRSRIGTTKILGSICAPTCTRLRSDSVKHPFITRLNVGRQGLSPAPRSHRRKNHF